MNFQDLSFLFIKFYTVSCLLQKFNFPWSQVRKLNILLVPSRYILVHTTLIIYSNTQHERSFCILNEQGISWGNRTMKLPN